MSTSKSRETKIRDKDNKSFVNVDSSRRNYAKRTNSVFNKTISPSPVIMLNQSGSLSRAKKNHLFYKIEGNLKTNPTSGINSFMNSHKNSISFSKMMNPDKFIGMLFVPLC
jgi:hypothetical protein